MSFQETSAAIWDSMNGNSPFDEGKRDTGPYTADFYGLEDDATVEYRTLEDYILSLMFIKNEQFFDYQEFGTNKNYWKKKQAQNIDALKAGMSNASFTYWNATSKKQETVKMLVLLNRRNNIVSNNFSTYSSFNLIQLKPYSDKHYLTFYYKGTESYRKEIVETEETTDFRIDNKYIAIQFRLSSFDDLYQLCNRLFPPDVLNNLLDMKASRYLKLIKNTTDITQLSGIYTNIPEALKSRIKNKISFELLLKHLVAFRKSDESNIVLDYSKAILSILNLAIAKDHKVVFDFFKKRPSFTKFLYFNMHGDTMLGNQEVECRFAYVSLLMGLCFLNGFEGLKITRHKYKVGAMYEPDSNIQIQEDKSTDVIYLRPYKTYIRKANWYEKLYSPWGIVVDETATGKGHWYHPFDMIIMVDEDSPDKTAMLVPAIFVKYLADAKEWEDVLRVVKLIVDVLLIVLSVVTLGSSSMLLFVFSVADLALATTDFLITLNSDVLMQTPEGREFLKIWEKISLIGGLAFAAPFLIIGAYRAGLKLLQKATSAETKNLIRSSLTAIIMHQNIFLKLEKNSLTLLLREEAVMKVFNYTFKKSQVTTLMNNGVLFMKGDVAIEKAIVKDQCFLIYDGKIIAAGDPKAMYKLIQKLSKLKKADFATEMGELAKKDVKALQKYKSARLNAKKRKYLENNPKAKRDLANHKAKRAAFHNETLVENGWSEKVTHIPMSKAELEWFFNAFNDLENGLKNRLNFATFNTIILRNKREIETISEFAVSGNKKTLKKSLGTYYKLPTNNIDVVGDDLIHAEFKKFSAEAKDFKEYDRFYDSELKFIFNFLKKHLHRGDEFIIEVKSLIAPCNSCRREFLMLEDLLRKQGKKVTFKMHYSDEMVNTSDTRKLLKYYIWK